MSVDADEWMRMKDPLKKNLGANRDVGADHRGRDAIFRILLPGVFLFLIFYYAFTYSPSVADFYCNAIDQWISKPLGAAKPAKGFLV